MITADYKYPLNALTQLINEYYTCEGLIAADNKYSIHE